MTFLPPCPLGYCDDGVRQRWLLVDAFFVGIPASLGLSNALERRGHPYDSPIADTKQMLCAR